MRDHTGRKRSLFVDGMDQFQPYQVATQYTTGTGTKTITKYTRYEDGNAAVYIRRDVIEQTVDNNDEVTAETTTTTYTVGVWSTAIAGNIASNLWKPINDTWTDAN